MSSPLCPRAALLLGMAALAGGASDRVVGAEEPPAVASVRPLAAVPGATTELTLRGARLGPVRELRTSWGAVAVLSDEEGAAERPDDRATFPLALPADAPLGIHAFRVGGSHGVSSQRLFVVDDLPTVEPTARGLSRTEPALIVPPCAVDGVLGNLERHYFQFSAAAGERLSIEVLARRIGSTLDPTLVLYQADGRQLASSDDVPGLGGDCQLVYRCAEAGTYVLELRDVRYRGGEGAVYRLRVGDFPCVQATLPMAVRRGTTAVIAFAGIDEEVEPASVTVPNDWPHSWFAVPARRAGGSGSGFTMLAVSDQEELVEAEPNDALEQAQMMTAGANVNGRFQEAGDVDRFRFSVTKGERWVFTGMTRREGAPTDLVLRLLDAEGKQLAQADDDGVEEGRLDHTFAADGEYVLVVSDLLHRGGPAYCYRVTTARYAPTFTLAVEGDALNVPAGGTAHVLLQVQRRDYNGEIDVAVEGLPAGYAADPVRIGAGLKQGVLTITAQPDAAPAPWTSVRIVGTATINGAEVRVAADAAEWLRGQWNKLVVVPPSTRGEIAAASTAAGRLTLRVEPQEVVFGRDLKATVTIRAERGEGVDGEIKLATLPDKGALPDQVSLDVKPIPKGEGAVTLEFSAKDKAPLGRFSVVLVGTLQQEKQTFTAPTPSINYRLDPPLRVTVNVGEAKLSRGNSTRWKITVERNPALPGAVKLTWKGLPAGVTAPEVELAADQSEVEVEATAAADAAPGEAAEITLTAASGEKGQFQAETRLPKVTVE